MLGEKRKRHHEDPKKRPGKGEKKYLSEKIKKQRNRKNNNKRAFVQKNKKRKHIHTLSLTMKKKNPSSQTFSPILECGNPHQ
jgi:hypothetical protein